MLGSLTLLDFDEQNWDVKKFEDFKSQIFNQVKLIIEEQAKIASQSEDLDMQNAGLTYLAKTADELNSISPPSDSAIVELNSQIKKNISVFISEYVSDMENTFSTIIPPYMKNSVEKEALASIDMF